MWPAARVATGEHGLTRAVFTGTVFSPLSFIFTTEVYLLTCRGPAGCLLSIFALRLLVCFAYLPRLSTAGSRPCVCFPLTACLQVSLPACRRLHSCSLQTRRLLTVCCLTADTPPVHCHLTAYPLSGWSARLLISCKLTASLASYFVLAVDLLYFRLLYGLLSAFSIAAGSLLRRPAVLSPSACSQSAVACRLVASLREEF